MLGAISMLILPPAYSSLLQLRKSIAKIIAAENLEHEQLLTLRVHHSNIRWVEEGRELVYNNQLYDVDSYQAVGDSIVFSGIADVEETNVERRLAKLLKAPSSERAMQTIAQNIIEFTSSLPPSSDLAIGYYELSTVRKLFHKRYDLLYSYCSIPSPPPDSLLTPPVSVSIQASS